jgi:hypothetical protein
MWLEDIVKKLAESNPINQAVGSMEKAVMSMTKHQDKITAATQKTIAKALPNIQQEIGANVLSGKPTGLEAAVQQQPSTSPLGSNINVPTQYGQIQGANEITPEMAKIGNMPVREPQGPGMLDKLGSVVKSEGRMGTDKAGPGVGNDLYKFVQSIGYGMIDKPLGREANTWDYLGKTVGQIARLNEGSGLQAGQSIYEQPREQMNQAVQLSQAKGETRLPSYAQSQEKTAVLSALNIGKYALKGDWSGELAKQDIKTFEDALSYISYKGLDPSDPEIMNALKRYPVLKNGKAVGKFAGFDTDGEILVE